MELYEEEKTKLFKHAKLALRIKSEAFDDEINQLVNSCLIDLETAGISVDEIDDLTITAVCTYVRMHFGEPTNFDQLKVIYDEIKTKMSMTGEWKK